MCKAACVSAVSLRHQPIEERRNWSTKTRIPINVNIVPISCFKEAENRYFLPSIEPRRPLFRIWRGERKCCFLKGRAFSSASICFVQTMWTFWFLWKLKTFQFVCRRLGLEDARIDRRPMDRRDPPPGGTSERFKVNSPYGCNKATPNLHCFPHLIKNLFSFLFCIERVKDKTHFNFQEPMETRANTLSFHVSEIEQQTREENNLELRDVCGSIQPKSLQRGHIALHFLSVPFYSLLLLLSRLFTYRSSLF